MKGHFEGKLYVVIHCVHTPNKPQCDGMAHTGWAVQHKHLMIVKYSDRPNSKWLRAQHPRIQLHQIWCTTFLQLRLCSLIFSLSLCPSCSFLSHLPRLKENKTKQSPVFLPLPFITFSYSLSPTNRSVSSHLFTPPSLFLTRIYLPPSFVLSFHVFPPFFFILLPLFFLCSPPPHTHTQSPVTQKRRFGGVFV